MSFVNIRNNGLFAYIMRGQLLWSAGLCLIDLASNKDAGKCNRLLFPKLTCRLHLIILQNNIQNKFDHFKNFKDFILKLNKPNWKIGKLGVKICLPNIYHATCCLNIGWSMHQFIVISWTLEKKKCEHFAIRTFWKQLETIHFRKKAKSNNKRNKLKSSSCSKRVYRDKICRQPE